MLYQHELMTGEVIALWVGDLENEDALSEYLGQAFERDFGFLLAQDELPEYARLFSEPRLRAQHLRPFLRADIRELLDTFSVAPEWIGQAEQLCRSQGYDAAKIVLVIPHLRYRPELCRNPQPPLRFIGNVPWPAGKADWEQRMEKQLLCPPFPLLRQSSFGGDSDAFDWRGIIHLKAWKGFATREQLEDEFMSHRFTASPDGDFDLEVTGPEVPSLGAIPTAAQRSAFQHLLDHEQEIRDAVLEGIFAVYDQWRENYYGTEISSDGGETYQRGWDQPDLFPPENMPQLSSAEELRRVIRLGTVHVLSQDIDGFASIGFGFDCKWDEEHGLGVLTHRGRLLEVGQADTAFTGP